ncbi:MAG TPA: hypothetical protein PLX65_06550 [Accumulibacter sp.]|jgi:hypothetical protein|nr:hypothetical protein [Accumulibacter sp.]
MSLTTFNAALLVGWLLILVGGVTYNLSAGLIFAGLILIIMVIVVSRIGGLYAKRHREID